MIKDQFILQRQKDTTADGHTENQINGCADGQMVRSTDRQIKIYLRKIIIVCIWEDIALWGQVEVGDSSNESESYA